MISKDKTARLGRRVGEHNATRFVYLTTLVTTACIDLLSLLAVYWLWSRSAPVLVVAVAALPLFVVSPPLILAARDSSTHRLTVYEGGVGLVTRHGEQIWLLDDLSGVSVGTTRLYRLYDVVALDESETHIYTLYVEGTPVLHINNRHYENVEGLAAALLEKTGEILYPRYIVEIELGNDVEFGDITVNNNGLWSDSQAVRWEEVNHWRANESSLSLFAFEGSKAKSFDIRGLPNAHVLVAIVASTLRGA